MLAVVLLARAGASPASAQVDYRNLDDDRPTFIEDAYPIERWAFELLAPWRYERMPGGGALHVFVPELAHGAHRNLQVGVKLPVARVSGADRTTLGLAGVRAFALYNVRTESIGLPALSLRSDVTLPAGSLGGEGVRAGVKGIATRSIGWHRVHVNVSWAGGATAHLAAVEALPLWSAGAALDRTVFRQSLLLVVEGYARRGLAAEPVELMTSLGARWQLSPTLVLDGGIGRRLGAHGPDLALTAGLSHAFAVRALMPRVPRRPRPPEEGP